MKILVTGGNGFIGSHLIMQLARNGHQIVAPVRKKEPFSADQVTWLNAPEFESVDWLRGAMKKIDVVIHAAAHAHRTQTTTLADKKLFQSVNVDLTLRIFDAAKKALVNQFVFISSIAAVTSESSQVVNENTIPSPTSDYGQSKLDAEKGLSIEADSQAIALTIIRPCLAYGPGNPGNMQRLSQLVDSRLPVPFGGIESLRTFVYVDNLVSAISACLMNEKSFGQIFLVCDDEMVTLQEIVKAIANAKRRSKWMFAVDIRILKFFGKVSDSFYRLSGCRLPLDSYSIDRLTSSLACSNDKIRKRLHWSPPYSFEQGISRTFDEKYSSH